MMPRLRAEDMIDRALAFRYIDLKPEAVSGYLAPIKQVLSPREDRPRQNVSRDALRGAMAGMGIGFESRSVK
jgi:hypothetical protein